MLSLTMRSITLAIVFFLATGSCLPASHAIKPSRKIQAAVEPILDAELAIQQNDSEVSEFRLGKRLGKVFDDQSPLGDESLVVLLSFYIGEASGGDLLHQITVRGKRMLPLLAEYKNKNVVLDHNSRFAKLRLPRDIRDENFSDATKAIRERKILGVD